MLGGSAGVSGDVLAGRDLEITWEDVYRGIWFSRLARTVEEGPARGCRLCQRNSANVKLSGVIQVTRRVKQSISMRRWREDFGWIGSLIGGVTFKRKDRP